ncbi:hypothetical protein ACFPRL_17220 [Pseudoclavibacter helvolus]
MIRPARFSRAVFSRLGGHDSSCLRCNLDDREDLAGRITLLLSSLPLSPQEARKVLLVEPGFRECDVLVRGYVADEAGKQRNAGDIRQPRPGRQRGPSAGQAECIFVGHFVEVRAEPSHEELINCFRIQGIDDQFGCRGQGQGVTGDSRRDQNPSTNTIKRPEKLYDLVASRGRRDFVKAIEGKQELRVMKQHSKDGFLGLRRTRSSQTPLRHFKYECGCVLRRPCPRELALLGQLSKLVETDRQAGVPIIGSLHDERP